MDARGIDVYVTAREIGFKIETLDLKQYTGNYFGLVLPR